MATLADVERLVAELPEAVEVERHGRQAWAVAGKVFAWVRPYSKADIKRFGDEPYPAQPIVAVSCADLNEKEAVLASQAPGIFTISHFDGYPAVLIEVRKVQIEQLRETLTDGWLTCAPQELAAAFISGS